MRLPAILALSLLPACVTTVDTAPPGLSSAVIHEAEATDAWQVVHGTRVVGWVLRFEVPENPGQFLFSVRNEHLQDVGTIDSLGRCFRLRPHQEPDWLGSGSVRDGVLRILAVDDSAELAKIPLSAVREHAETRR